MPYQTVFKAVPVLILVYAGPYDTIAEMLLADGIMPREEVIKYANPNLSTQISQSLWKIYYFLYTILAMW